MGAEICSVGLKTMIKLGRLILLTFDWKTKKTKQNLATKNNHKQFPKTENKREK